MVRKKHRNNMIFIISIEIYNLTPLYVISNLGNEYFNEWSKTYINVYLT